MATDASGTIIHQSFRDEIKTDEHGNYNNNRIATDTELSYTSLLVSFKQRNVVTMTRIIIDTDAVGT